MAPTGKHHQPDEGQDEAENGDAHDPAQRVRYLHVGARHQDPHQTADDLQGYRGIRGTSSNISH